MTTAEHDELARLVGDPKRFLEAVFGQRPLLIPAADPTGFSDLLALDDVDHLVSASALRAPAFRLVRHGKTLVPTRRATIGSRTVSDLIDVAAVHREFAAGATIVLQGLHRTWPSVAALCRSLEATLTHPVQANAYLTPPVAQGLKLHADPHDVFAVQIHGQKRWVVEPDGEPSWDLVLDPGDVLYLPAGTRHAAQTVEEPSLHLTLGIKTITWRSLIERAWRATLDQSHDEARADLDAPLPAGWADEPSSLAANLHDQLTTLAAQLSSSDVEPVLQGAAAHFHTTRHPDRRGGLRDLLEVGGLHDATLLERRAGSGARTWEDDEVLHLALVDRRLTMPARLAPAVHTVLTARRLRPRDLDDHLDRDSRLVLCRRLVREGLLRIVPDALAAPPADA